MRKIDEKMPDLLRNLSNLNGSGILFSNSLKLMAESKMGILTKELKKLKERYVLGCNFKSSYETWK